MEAGLEGRAALFDGGFKLFAGDAPTQTSNQCGGRRGIKDVPHFSFGFTAEQGGECGRRVDLKRESVTGIEQFDQERETRRARWSRPPNDGIGPKLFNELPEGLAGGGAVGNDGLGVGPVADFPAFADVPAGGKGFAVAGEGGTAPDAFDEDGFEFVWVKHVALAVIGCFP